MAEIPTFTRIQTTHIGTTDDFTSDALDKMDPLDRLLFAKAKTKENQEASLTGMIKEVEQRNAQVAALNKAITMANAMLKTFPADAKSSDKLFKLPESLDEKFGDKLSSVLTKEQNVSIAGQDGAAFQDQFVKVCAEAQIPLKGSGYTVLNTDNENAALAATKKGDLELFVQSAQGKINELNSTQQMAMIHLAKAKDALETTIQDISGLVKKRGEVNDTIVRNSN